MHILSNFFHWLKHPFAGHHNMLPLLQRMANGRKKEKYTAFPEVKAKKFTGMFHWSGKKPLLTDPVGPPPTERIGQNISLPQLPGSVAKTRI